MAKGLAVVALAGVLGAGGIGHLGPGLVSDHLMSGTVHALAHVEAHPAQTN
jgi:hypothetical protein